MKEDIETLIRCPLTKLIFNNPVIASDGHVYEKEELLNYLKIKNISPITNVEFKSNEIFDVYHMKHLIECYLKENPEEKDEVFKSKYDFLFDYEKIHQIKKIYLNMFDNEYYFNKLINFLESDNFDQIKKFIDIVEDIEYKFNDFIIEDEHCTLVDIIHKVCSPEVIKYFNIEKSYSNKYDKKKQNLLFWLYDDNMEMRKRKSLAFEIGLICDKSCYNYYYCDCHVYHIKKCIFCDCENNEDDNQVESDSDEELLENEY